MDTGGHCKQLGKKLSSLRNRFDLSKSALAVMNLHNSVIERINSRFACVQESHEVLKNAIRDNVPGQETFRDIYLTDLEFYMTWLGLVDLYIEDESHF